MIGEVDIQNEINRIGYFAVIPATVLFNNELKPNEKLLYALITALSNKEGYCYASNKYLGEKLGVDPKIAAEDACRMEHVISAESFDAIKKHVRLMEEKLKNAEESKNQE